MTLLEAIRSGRAFTRPSLQAEFGYITSDDIGDAVVLSTADVTATDYILEPAGKMLSATDLATAWDAVRRDFTSVKGSHESALFQKLSARLFGG